MKSVKVTPKKRGITIRRTKTTNFGLLIKCPYCQEEIVIEVDRLDEDEVTH